MLNIFILKHQESFVGVQEGDVGKSQCARALLYELRFLSEIDHEGPPRPADYYTAFIYTLLLKHQN